MVLYIWYSCQIHSSFLCIFVIYQQMKAEKSTMQVSLQDLENAFLIGCTFDAKENKFFFFMDHLYFQTFFVSSKFVFF